MATSDGPVYAVQLLKPFWRLLRRYPQIPSDVLDEYEQTDPEKGFPVGQSQQLLTATVKLTGDENLGLLAARETDLGDFAILEYVAASSANWRQGIETLFRYSKLVNQVADFYLEEQGDKAHAVLRSLIPLSRVAIDFQSGAFHVAVRRWLNPTPPELEAWFSYPEPADTSEHAATFEGVKLVFNAPWDGFAFDVDRLDTPLTSADPSLHRVLRQHADRLIKELAPGDSAAEQVRAHILSTLQEGRTGAEATASHLGLSRRTLTRRLQQEGTSFTQLLEEVRRRMATQYLEETDHSVEDIAFLLGFSESASFVRAFKRWVGKPPLAYRRAKASSAAALARDD